MDLINRDDFEAQVARAIARVNGRHRREIIDLLGDPPDPGRVDAAFWEKASDELQAVLRPAIERVALESAEQFAGSSVIGVDWGLVNQIVPRRHLERAGRMMALNPPPRKGPV